MQVKVGLDQGGVAMVSLRGAMLSMFASRRHGSAGSRRRARRVSLLWHAAVLTRLAGPHRVAFVRPGTGELGTVYAVGVDGVLTVGRYAEAGPRAEGRARAARTARAAGAVREIGRES